MWDIQKRIIPDSLCLGIAVVGLLNFTQEKLFGIMLGLPLLIAALVREGGMGGGDIKLTAACGFVLGLSIGSFGLAIGLIAALAWYMVTNCIRRIKHLSVLNTERTTLPLSPFLSIGFIVAAIFKLGSFLPSMI